MSYFLYRFQDKFRAVKSFFRNCWRFRKELSNFYDWNYDLGLFRKTLELNHAAITNGNEVDISRLKKLDKMARAIEILKHFEKDDFIDLAELEIGRELIHYNFEFVPVEDKPGYSEMVDKYSDEEKELNYEIFDLSGKLSNDMWNELWLIVKGQDINEYKAIMDSLSEEEKRSKDVWNDWFDGSGLLGYWD